MFKACRNTKLLQRYRYNYVDGVTCKQIRQNHQF